MDPGRYARLEDEQRYIMHALPESATAPRRIEDRYVTGTSLRLRKVTDGDAVVHKLGHKVRADEQRPSAVWHTTCYLREDEFDVLAALPAALLVKHRYAVPGGGSCDVFAGPLDGLILFEADRPATPPKGAVAEVSDDVAFTGGALAALGAHDAARLVEAARVR